MEFLSEYGLFLAKAVTVVVALLLIISAIASAAIKEKQSQTGHIEVKNLNKKFDKLKHQILEEVIDEETLKALDKEKKKQQKAEAKKNKSEKTSEDDKKRTFVLDFHGDIKASDNEQLRQTITSVLAVATPGKDEIVVRLESGGGMVHSYGLAAAQLQRIKAKGITLTACVDKVAASGGYMMACVADKVVASPFAILGSIGVVAQIPNVHKLLKKNNIDFDVLTAGEHKRTLTIFGENTEKGREKFIEDLEDTHELFKTFVSENRPVVDIKEVANGDVWFGQRAKDVNLVDELKTSDEYIIEQVENADVYEVKFVEKKSIQEKLGLAASVGVEKAVTRLWSEANNNRFMS